MVNAGINFCSLVGMLAFLWGIIVEIIKRKHYLPGAVLSCSGFIIFFYAWRLGPVHQAVYIFLIAAYIAKTNSKQIKILIDKDKRNLLVTNFTKKFTKFWKANRNAVAIIAGAIIIGSVLLSMNHQQQTKYNQRKSDYQEWQKSYNNCLSGYIRSYCNQQFPKPY